MLFSISFPRFTALFKKYHAEVYPANLVFVSFLRSQHAAGLMVPQLERESFSVKQLRLEGSRPDLTRLDDLFAQLSASTTSSFLEDVKEAEATIKTDGLPAFFGTISNASNFSQEE